MSRHYLSIGSNIDPARAIPAGLAELRKAFGLVQVSATYETDPVGPAHGDRFWNLAARLETTLLPGEIIRILRDIEARAGRVRTPDKFAPRILDIDLLPQPGYQQLAFIMIPLAEIAPEECDEETGKTFFELAAVMREEAGNFRKKLPGAAG